MKNPYNTYLCLLMVYFVYGFILASPKEIFDGIVAMVMSPDILVTDYIAVGGLGATFVNAGLVGLMCLCILRFFKYEPDGYAIMTLWLSCGFSFFGKNPINIIPILCGGFLFSKFIKEPFHKNVVATILGTTLSPAVSQMSFVQSPFNDFPMYIFGPLLGLAIGFIIEPITKNSIKSHSGYNLYNVGFAAGILGIIIMSVFRNVGIDFIPVNIWSSGNNFVLAMFICTLSVLLIIIGLFCETSKLSLYTILKMDSTQRDYLREIKEYTYINMGILGLFSVAFVLLVGTELSGPVIGAIFAVVGYGGYGKRLSNIIPLMIGSGLAALISRFDTNSSDVVITILFSTCLAPITDHFGIRWGILAGFMHLNLALNLGITHGGLNLYNNGLAGGFVAMMMVPIIKALMRRQKNHPSEKDAPMHLDINPIN